MRSKPDDQRSQPEPHKREQPQQSKRDPSTRHATPMKGSAGEAPRERPDPEHAHSVAPEWAERARREGKLPLPE